MPELARFVSATEPVLVDAPAPPQLARDAERRDKAQLALAERVRRWREIEAVNGTQNWIDAEIVRKGLTAGADKDSKKAEAAERRALKKLAWSAYTATHINHVGAGIHWSDHIDVDRFDIDNREQRAAQLGLPALPDPQALADALGLTIPHLRVLCTHRDVDASTHYRRFLIPKRDGSARTIAEPMPVLKEAQRFLLTHILEKLEVHAAAHGFLQGRNIVSNAAVHAGASVVVKLDIKDFFPTITFERVKGLLRKAGLVEQVATLCALLATEAPRDVMRFRGETLYVATGARALPQGAPSSPMITNALCLRLDRRMSGLARKLGLAYTRYADDLTFSWRGPVDKSPTGQLVGTVTKILASEGFALNEKKTAVMKAGARQSVTGLVVNRAEGKPAARVPRELKRKLRAALHNRRQGKAGPEDKAQLQGLAAFLYMTDPVAGGRFLAEVAALT
ncbi:MAG TPA: reverse transcriptase family protein [Myxococcota bacterium]|jgi:hypothetical protein